MADIVSLHVQFDIPGSYNGRNGKSVLTGISLHNGEDFIIPKDAIGNWENMVVITVFNTRGWSNAAELRIPFTELPAVIEKLQELQKLMSDVRPAEFL